MKTIYATFLIGLALCSPLQAKGPTPNSGTTVTPIIKTDKTISDSPILLPQGNVEVVASLYEISEGASLPIHKHPYPRYGYMLSGTLLVYNEETRKSQTFKAGDFIVDPIGQWHKGTSIGSESVKLLVIDQVKKGETNVVLQK
jgi:quercetin dioxygenase-like cupin family protein